MALSDERLREIERKFNAERVRTSDEEYLVIYPSDYYDWQRAIEAEVRKQDDALILQLVEALEESIPRAMGGAEQRNTALIAARARLGEKP